MTNSEIVDELLSITQISAAEMTARKGCWDEVKVRLSLCAVALGYPYEAEPVEQLPFDLPGETVEDRSLNDAIRTNQALPLISRNDDA